VGKTPYSSCDSRARRFSAMCRREPRLESALVAGFPKDDCEDSFTASAGLEAMPKPKRRSFQVSPGRPVGNFRLDRQQPTMKTRCPCHDVAAGGQECPDWKELHT